MVFEINILSSNSIKIFQKSDFLNLIGYSHCLKNATSKDYYLSNNDKYYIKMMINNFTEKYLKEKNILKYFTLLKLFCIYIFKIYIFFS